MILKSVDLGENSQFLTTLRRVLGSRVYGRLPVEMFVRKDSYRQGPDDIIDKKKKELGTITATETEFYLDNNNEQEENC